MKRKNWQRASIAFHNAGYAVVKRYDSKEPLTFWLRAAKGGWRVEITLRALDEETVAQAIRELVDFDEESGINVHPSVTVAPAASTPSAQ